MRARIRSLDVYSGHADGPELAAWVRKRLPIAHNVFLVHGELPAFEGMRDRLAGIVEPEAIIIPDLDAVYELTGAGAVLQSKRKAPRLDREQVAHLDWHNDLSQLFLDISEVVGEAADERSRTIILRRLRRVLEDDGAQPNS